MKETYSVTEANKIIKGVESQTRLSTLEEVENLIKNKAESSALTILLREIKELKQRYGDGKNDWN